MTDFGHTPYKNVNVGLTEPKEIEHFRVVCGFADISRGGRVREDGISGFENRPSLPFGERAALDPLMVEHERDDRRLIHAVRDGVLALEPDLIDIALDKMPLQLRAQGPIRMWAIGGLPIFICPSQQI